MTTNSQAPDQGKPIAEARINIDVDTTAARAKLDDIQQEAGPKYPEIEVGLIGEDGNAANIIGKVRLALRRARVPASEIDQFCREAMSGDYDNVLATAMRWVDVS